MNYLFWSRCSPLHLTRSAWSRWNPGKLLNLMALQQMPSIDHHDLKTFLKILISCFTLRKYNFWQARLNSLCSSISGYFLTWNSDEKFDGIAMSVEWELRLRHRAERHERLRRQRLASVVGINLTGGIWRSSKGYGNDDPVSGSHPKAVDRNNERGYPDKGESKFSRTFKNIKYILKIIIFRSY